MTCATTACLLALLLVFVVAGDSVPTTIRSHDDVELMYLRFLMGKLNLTEPQRQLIFNHGPDHGKPKTTFASTKVGKLELLLKDQLREDRYLKLLLKKVNNKDWSKLWKVYSANNSSEPQPATESSNMTTQSNNETSETHATPSNLQASTNKIPQKDPPKDLTRIKRTAVWSSPIQTNGDSSDVASINRDQIQMLSQTKVPSGQVQQELLQLNKNQASQLETHSISLDSVLKQLSESEPLDVPTGSVLMTSGPQTKVDQSQTVTYKIPILGPDYVTSTTPPGTTSILDKEINGKLATLSNQILEVGKSTTKDQTKEIKVFIPPANQDSELSSAQLQSFQDKNHQGIEENTEKSGTLDSKVGSEVPYIKPDESANPNQAFFPLHLRYPEGSVESDMTQKNTYPPVEDVSPEESPKFPMLLRPVNAVSDKVDINKPNEIRGFPKVFKTPPEQERVFPNYQLKDGSTKRPPYLPGPDSSEKLFVKPIHNSHWSNHAAHSGKHFPLSAIANSQSSQPKEIRVYVVTQNPPLPRKPLTDSNSQMKYFSEQRSPSQPFEPKYVGPSVKGTENWLLQRKNSKKKPKLRKKKLGRRRKVFKASRQGFVQAIPLQNLPSVTVPAEQGTGMPQIFPTIANYNQHVMPVQNVNQHRVKIVDSGIANAGQPVKPAEQLLLLPGLATSGVQNGAGFNFQQKEVNKVQLFRNGKLETMWRPPEMVIVKQGEEEEQEGEEEEEEAE